MISCNSISYRNSGRADLHLNQCQTIYIRLHRSKFLIHGKWSRLMNFPLGLFPIPAPHSVGIDSVLYCRYCNPTDTQSVKNICCGCNCNVTQSSTYSYLGQIENLKTGGSCFVHCGYQWYITIIKPDNLTAQYYRIRVRNSFSSAVKCSLVILT